MGKSRSTNSRIPFCLFFFTYLLSHSWLKALHSGSFFGSRAYQTASKIRAKEIIPRQINISLWWQNKHFRQFLICCFWISFEKSSWKFGLNLLLKFSQLFAESLKLWFYLTYLEVTSKCFFLVFNCHSWVFEPILFYLLLFSDLIIECL